MFLDIGGVLLTNGWDHVARNKAIAHFKLDREETEERHHLSFDTYETGKISLAEYLSRVVFYEKRTFTRSAFRDFMFSQSQADMGMIDFIRALRKKHQLKIAVVSNEGRELTEYRIRKFRLGEFVDFFISSCFVHFRKPDPDIYKIALDIAQVAPEKVVYIEDRMMFVQVAEKEKIVGIRHIDLKTTRDKLKKWDLVL